MTAKDHFEQGKIFYAAKEYERALNCFYEATKMDDKYAAPWNGKGNVYEVLFAYEKALECFDKAIELNPKFAYPWNGKGNVYDALSNHDKSLECFDKAIELDNKDAGPWHGKGNVYYSLKKYKKSLEYYNKAIELDNKDADLWHSRGNVYYSLKKYKKSLENYNKAIELDENLAYSWNGKGIVFDVLKDYSRAKKCFIRSNYLGNDLLNNSLELFSKYPQAPLYCYELLKEFIHSKNYKNWRGLINLTLEQCQPIITYVSYLKLIDKKEQLEQWEWYQWLGIVYYYMGHTIKSYEYLKKVVATQKEDLMSYYYLILSCRGFAEPEEIYLGAALEIAEQIKPRKRGFDFFNKKPVLSYHELLQIYYAGQLLYLKQKFNEALFFFENIMGDFLPAAYMCLELKGGASNKLVKEIIRAERKVLNTARSFLSGIPEQNLDLELESFRVPFFKYAQYYEIKTGIGLLEYELGDSDFNDFEPVFPDTLKAFWYTWRLSPQQYKQIFEEARKEGYRRLTNKILKDRKRELKNQGKRVTESEEDLKTRIEDEGSAILWNEFEKLEKETNPSRLEKRIGAMLNDYKDIKLHPEYYRKLTSVFVLNKKLNYKQKIYLDFYSILKEYEYKKPSETLIAGEKDVLKALISLGIDQLTDDEKITGQLIDIFVKSFAKGSLAQLMAQWLKTPNPKFKKYWNFKIHLLEFIGAEKKRLGNDFEKRYPLFGFEEWLK